jgi:hypothetical protein
MLGLLDKQQRSAVVIRIFTGPLSSFFFRNQTATTTVSFENTATNSSCGMWWHPLGMPVQINNFESGKLLGECIHRGVGFFRK